MAAIAARRMKVFTLLVSLINMPMLMLPLHSLPLISKVRYMPWHPKLLISTLVNSTFTGHASHTQELQQSSLTRRSQLGGTDAKSVQTYCCCPQDKNATLLTQHLSVTITVTSTACPSQGSCFCCLNTRKCRCICCTDQLDLWPPGCW